MEQALHAQLTLEFRHLTQPGSSLSAAKPLAMWQYQVSEPFPLDWPPSTGLALVKYVYALGFDFTQLADAVYVAEPWARLLASTGGEVWQFDSLNPRPGVIGIQGVRPVSPLELAMTLEPIEKLLNAYAANADDLSSAKAIRGYYHNWMQSNGVIAEVIRSLHPAFCHWIDVGSRADR